MSERRRVTRVLLAGCWVAGGLVVAAIGLRACGLLIPYRLPTQGMHPTLRVGDQFFTESVTYLRRDPARGDVVAFSTRGIPMLRNDETYVKRLVGLPGDIVQIREGALFVNNAPTDYRTPDGTAIRYINAGILSSSSATYKVPADGYFVLGDNSVNSQDSRYWGAVPKGDVRGRVWFRYWPWR